MKKLATLLLLLITFYSCSTSQKMVKNTSNTIGHDSNATKITSNYKLNTEPIQSDLSVVDLTPIDLSFFREIPVVIHTQANRIVDYAFAFDGVKYKRGGTTIEGMDCSGLVVTAFDSENISLPRISKEIARTGDPIDLKKVNKGDLLFFATRKNSRTISHVGIVTTARDGFVEFIHASTSNGVIVSNMAEKYWHYAFIQARRII